MGAEGGVGQVDEFVRRLWKGWKEIREEGIVQVSGLALRKADSLKEATSPCISVSFAQTISSTPARDRHSVLNRSSLTRYLPRLARFPKRLLHCTGVGRRDTMCES